MQSSEISQRVRERLFEKLDLAYVCLDHSFVVKTVSDNLTQFGFDEIPSGSDVTDHIDFMVGVDTHTELELPIVSSPSGKPISVTLMPDEDGLILVVSDASALHSHRQQLQQKANENELLVNEQQKLMQELTLIQDDLKQKNSELEEAGRLQSSFLSGVSHEFRTPLTSIIGYTNLLDRYVTEMSSEVEQPLNYLSAVRRSSKHLLSLVENLLDHGKLDSGEIVINPKIINLAEVFNDVAILMTPLTITKNIEFSIKHSFNDSAMAMVDDSRLRQCLINIIGNAIKFTDVGGVTVTTDWQDDLLIVKVDDTGMGISEENLEKIRLPFWQAPDTGKAGTGLGLTITERIINLMGGSLQIDSQENSKTNQGTGQGATVTFSFIVSKIDESQAEKFESIETNKDIHILLAEDDADISDIVTLMLQESGIRVTKAENGALAVDLCRSHDFDLILMDIHMPVMDGYTAVDEIRNSGDKTPIVIMSAASIESDKGKAEQLGCEGYLTKPVDVLDIIAIANHVMASVKNATNKNDE